MQMCGAVCRHGFFTLDKVIVGSLQTKYGPLEGENLARASAGPLERENLARAVKKWQASALRSPAGVEHG